MFVSIRIRHFHIIITASQLNFVEVSQETFNGHGMLHLMKNIHLQLTCYFYNVAHAIMCECEQISPKAEQQRHPTDTA